MAQDLPNTGTLWKGCKHVKIENSEQVVSCSSIQTYNESTIAFRYERSVQFTLYYTFFDTKLYEVCDANSVSQLFKKYSIDSCLNLYCNNYPKLSNSSLSYLNRTYGISNIRDRQSALGEFAWMMNYCQYCQREDFVDFHTQLQSVNTSRCFQYVRDDFCNYNQPVPEGSFEQPLIHGESLLEGKTLTPWICYCGNDLFGYKCDYFSTNFIPFTFQAYPVITFIISGMLAIATIIFNVIPLCYRNYKKIRTSIKHHFKTLQRALYEEVFTLNWLIIFFVFSYFVFLTLENILGIPLNHVYDARIALGYGFFRSLSLLWLIAALVTTLVMWVNLLLGSMRTTTDALVIHPGLKALLVIVYVILLGMSILPFVYAADKSVSKIFNLVFFSLTAASAVIFTIFFVVFGAKLFFTLKVANNLSFFQIKFTKFVMFLIVAFAVTFLEMIFIIVEYGAHRVVFGLFYRSINFNTLDLTMCVLVSGIIYQMTSNVEFKQIYCPCVKDSTFQKYQDYITRKSGKFKKVNTEDEDESSIASDTRVGTAYSYIGSDEKTSLSRHENDYQ
ncbi:hypothetical protein C9374_011511 [Naegleria lovaniensis]|uniref:Uncharacterized protein n=1 Tax=Naegleria lovaniensis TaxID=51637 RepID=A0AA88H4Q1_NAELO|nr:uncharacterized protein C9374_011511 [Naegleria lovaniensis]KAG2392786.1 hypothetical protein C9374_011511 [Naegleria lovaniensis]